MEISRYCQDVRFEVVYKKDCQWIYQKQHSRAVKDLPGVLVESWFSESLKKFFCCMSSKSYVALIHSDLKRRCFAKNDKQFSKNNGNLLTLAYDAGNPSLEYGDCGGKKSISWNSAIIHWCYFQLSLMVTPKIFDWF